MPPSVLLVAWVGAVVGLGGGGSEVPTQWTCSIWLLFVTFLTFFVFVFDNSGRHVT